MKITLIRHSKTILEKDKPITCWKLSQEGIKLAEVMSKKEEIKGLDVIYSSLQTKALHTAVILAKDNYIQIKTHPDLTEITSFTKKFFGEKYQEKIEQFYSGEVRAFFGGETAKVALGRFNIAIQKIVAEANREACQNVGIVSHSNILSFFSAQYIDVKPVEIEKEMKMPDLALFDFRLKRFLKFFNEIEI